MRRQISSGERNLFKPKFDKPDYLDLLSKPFIKKISTDDFDEKMEAQHLSNLFDNNIALGNYQYIKFINAGANGMVFEVRDEEKNTWALKVARKQLYDTVDERIATSLSPVSEAELRTLRKLSHPNVVRLKDAIEENGKIIAISTSYVEEPTSIDSYLESTLALRPKRLHPFSPLRLDNSCIYLSERILEIAQALLHLHEMGIFHFDVKPANILISKTTKNATLTDMGSCINMDEIKEKKEIRVYFSWTYAHPDLTDMVSNPQSITGGGLHVSAEVSRDNLNKYDLFSFGKTIQECLAVIVNEFKARAYSSYPFRFLHMISCMLLDGRNVPGKDHQLCIKKDKRSFVDDQALGYPLDLYAKCKIRSISELIDRLKRINENYSWNSMAIEFNIWDPRKINSVVNSPAPFTDRVERVFNHPAFRRLKRSTTLGWMKEIYPGATHDRWSHSLGVFSGLVSCFQSLLADPALPTLKIVINKDDIEHAFLAAILHDLGQTTFGHDIEEACPYLYDHQKLSRRIMKDTSYSKDTLEKTVKDAWINIDIDRINGILDSDWKKGCMKPIDGVASDLINGPVDVDKLDYLLRDSIHCGVAYGHGMDPQRFMHALSVGVKKEANEFWRYAIAYNAKGRPALESLLLSRYQMYGAVYWHHTFRCIRAMFSCAAAKTFGMLENGGLVKKDGTSYSLEKIAQIFYARVICEKQWKEIEDYESKVERAPLGIANEPALDFIWQFARMPERDIIIRLAHRKLFKRVFELRVGELGNITNYDQIRSQLQQNERLAKAARMQRIILDKIFDNMRRDGPIKSVSETEAKKRIEQLKAMDMPLILIDFPMKGVSLERNIPEEIGDSQRKYFTTIGKEDKKESDSVFHAIRDMQRRMATLRIFAAPELHELVVRYVNVHELRDCTQEVIDCIRT